jgi:hypothetical protein
MAIGIIDRDEQRLKYVYDEVVNWVRANSAEYDQMAGKDKRTIQ